MVPYILGVFHMNTWFCIWVFCFIDSHACCPSDTCLLTVAEDIWIFAVNGGASLLQIGFPGTEVLTGRL